MEDVVLSVDKKMRNIFSQKIGALITSPITFKEGNFNMIENLSSYIQGSFKKV